MLKQWQSTFILVLMNNKDGDTSCHCSVHDVDVGALIRQETDFKSLNQAEKLNIIDNHFRPAEDFVFPRSVHVILGLFTVKTAVSVSHAFCLLHARTWVPWLRPRLIGGQR